MVREVVTNLPRECIRKRGVFGPGGRPFFMQMFALTLFRGFGVVALYQTAVFAGIFGGLVDHE